MVDILLLLGVAVVLPMAVGGRWVAWELSAGAAGAALLLPRGAGAAALVLPWLVVAGHRSTMGLIALVGRHRRPPTVAAAARVLAALYAVVAALSFVASRLGAELFGVGEPIVELTAVHYTYAGCAALTLAVLALERSVTLGRGRRLALAAVVLTGVAPPVVAVGFVAGEALPQVGGAVLMTLGVWATASLHLAEVATSRATSRAPGGMRGWARALLAVSGLAVWAPMVLAVAWACGQHWDVPTLSVPDMARTHGVANALGFTVAGLAARRLAGPPAGGEIGRRLAAGGDRL